jgi:RND family efflux transporter MFP subunit
MILTIILIGAAAGLSWMIFHQFQRQTGASRLPKTPKPTPVDVAPIERGSIELRRSFSGALEALSEFVVAPKVSGRVERLFVDISDVVKRGQVVGELDNAEYVQAVAQARAELAVAKANLARAKSVLEIAERELERSKSLRKRGIVSISEFDAIKADLLAKQAQLEVSKAEVIKAESELETAKIRLGYTKVIAGWNDGNEHRIVAERYLDEGHTVSANAPLLLIVEFSPIKGVFFVTERDYAQLRLGQIVSLATDAYPGESFKGRIDRIAPVFRRSTRQARVEILIQNSQRRLKPGMFIRATVTLNKVPGATIIPEQALTTRNDHPGIFVVNPDGKTVVWRQIKLGIREGNRVQVEGEGLAGLVVTLGQQFLDNGSKIVIPDLKTKTKTRVRKAKTR